MTDGSGMAVVTRRARWVCLAAWALPMLLQAWGDRPHVAWWSPEGTGEAGRVIWSTEPGRLYTLEESVDLETWSIVPGYPRAAGGFTQEEAITGGDDPVRFFRVRALGGPPEGVQGIEPIEDALPYRVDPDEPVSILLSRSRYPAEDAHLDAILWIDPGASGGDSPPGGRLLISLRAQDGTVLWSEEIFPIPGRRLFLSPRFPSELADAQGSLRVEWLQGEVLLGSAEAAFRVAPHRPVPLSGRVRIEIPNEEAVAAHAVPFTVGVPFPRGALRDVENVRWLDEAGREVPVQVTETARWSRFGTVKWLRCDFTADLDGGRRHFDLEYAPTVRRTAFPGLASARLPGFPWVSAGRLRTDAEGVWLLAEDGTWRKVLDAEALSGGYVVHEDGREYRMDPAQAWTLDESGPERAVALTWGWFRDPANGEGFCQYVTRVFLHRGSPLMRILHTWIFTGDAYEDRIRDIGWRFPAAPGLVPDGFLTAFGPAGPWVQGDYLLQHDYDAFEIISDGTAVFEGGRAPGVMGISGGGTRLLAGVRDFWQNYPHELEFDGGDMVYHLWPRHGKPVRHSYDTLALRDVPRLWFAHEGELLDFAMPEEYFTRPEFLEAMQGHHLGNGVFRETVNAQGVAKTAEIWLHFGDEADGVEDAVGLLGGLQERTVRAVVDPVWVCASGAFYEAHPFDPEQFPEEERVYALHASAPPVWAERLRYYGKWIWGDVNWDPHLRERFGVVYRAYRKAHQGWPYSWLPYARSGTPNYLAFADAATRYLADVAFCHYVDERAWIYTGGAPQTRKRGFFIRSEIPWGTHRYWVGPTNNDFTDKCNYLLHAWYLTGYERARDVALDWAYLTQHEPAGRYDIFGQGVDDWSRNSVTILQSYVEMYEAFFQPWFLAAAHEVARQQMIAFREKGWTGHFWNPGPREFHRFTGSPEYETFYLAYARAWLDPQYMTGWAQSAPQLEAASYASLLTGDEYFPGRVEGWLSQVRAFTFEGEPDYFRGFAVSGGARGNGPLFTGYFLQQLPMALHTLHAAGHRPAPIHTGHYQLGADIEPLEGGGFRYRHPAILALKQEGEPLSFRLRIQQETAPDEPEFFHYRVLGPGGEREDFEGFAAGENWLHQPPRPADWSFSRLTAMDVATDPVDAGNTVLRLCKTEDATQHATATWTLSSAPWTGRFTASVDVCVTQMTGTGRIDLRWPGEGVTNATVRFHSSGAITAWESDANQVTLAAAGTGFERERWYRVAWAFDLAEAGNRFFDASVHELTGAGGMPVAQVGNTGRRTLTDAETASVARFYVLVNRGAGTGDREFYLDHIRVVAGTPMEGSWDVSAVRELVVPAAAPAGVYRVEIEGVSRFPPTPSYRASPALAVPLTPPGTPEVMALGESRTLGPASSQTRSQYWFRAPPDAAAAWVDFTISSLVRRPKPGQTTRWCDLVRLGVWDGDGNAAWLREFSGHDYDGPDTIRAEFAVPPGQRGRLWQITIPQLNPGFTLGPALPPYLAVDPERWFEP